MSFGRYILACFVYSILLSCCNDNIIPIPVNGNGQHEINGLIHSLDIVAVGEENVSIHLSHYSDNLKRYYLSFIGIPVDSGIYQLHDWSSSSGNPDNDLSVFFMTLIDGDIVGNNYILLNQGLSQLVIDSVSQEVEFFGQFMFDFVIDTTKQNIDTAYPDTIQIRNGQFQVKLKN